MAETRVDDAGGELPGASRSARSGGGALSIATGLFSLIIGLLLRGSISGQDRTDWNSAVRTFLEVFPLLLIVGGAVLLIVAFVRMSGRSGATRGGADGSSPSTAHRGVAASTKVTGRADEDASRSHPGRVSGRPATSGRAYAAQQREALARLKAERERGDA